MAEDDSTGTEIDFSHKTREMDVFSAGSLEEIDEQQRITVHWFKERMVAVVSLAVILTLLCLSVFLIVSEQDPDTKDWAKQIATTLLGFAAGAIWQVQKKKWLLA